MANHWTASVYIRTVFAVWASAASASRNELISGWNDPEAWRRRGGRAWAAAWRITMGRREVSLPAERA